MFIADRNTEGAKACAASLNGNAKDAVSFGEVDVTDWESQAACFEKALAESGGRIDYVYPIAGIGERVWLPNDPSKKSGFVKPDFAVLDADLNGVLYTVALALQQFRRQEPDSNGFRGKVAPVASVCGFYCSPTVPVYTAAKHGVVGFTRSFGKYLPEEGITMNAVCPNVIRTNISAPAFYELLESKGVLTPMKGLIEAFESMLGSSSVSGEIFEVGPNGGYQIRPAQEFMDVESKAAIDAIYERARHMQRPVGEKHAGLDKSEEEKKAQAGH